MTLARTSGVEVRPRRPQRRPHISGTLSRAKSRHCCYMSRDGRGALRRLFRRQTQPCSDRTAVISAIYY